MDLSVTLRDDKTASGDLYLDDGESIDAEINNYSYMGSSTYRDYGCNVYLRF